MKAVIVEGKGCSYSTIPQPPKREKSFEFRRRLGKKMGKKRKRNNSSKSSKLKSEPEDSLPPSPNDSASVINHSNNRLPISFPPHAKRPSDGYLTQVLYPESFQEALLTSYKGFVMDENAIDFEKELQKELEELPFFRKDVTQPFGLGTPCAATKVTRCLLGDPGTTYKYLGLRMFAYPWENTVVNRLRHVVTARTQEHNCSAESRGLYNVCLINCMDPPSKQHPWKRDTTDAAYSTAVSWHADSSLEHFSTIAVYQTMIGGDCRSSPWSIGLRVAPNAEGPGSGGAIQQNNVDAPPLAVQLPTNSCYYMLRDFNHHHQHAVLFRQPEEASIESRRYSCTFRLLRSQNHTVQELLDRCRKACQSFHKKGTRLFRSEQLLLTEIESEWLRQYYIQGHQSHLHPHWKRWIQELWLYWSRLEHRTAATVQWLQRATLYTSSTTTSRKERDKQSKAHQQVETIRQREAESKKSDDTMYSVLADSLESRTRMRQLWTEREQDVLRVSGGSYRAWEFSAAWRVPDPSCPRSSPLPSDTSAIVTALRNGTSLQDFVENDDWLGTYALEMQQPWSMAVVEGRKSIETRGYDLPKALVGRKLYILETATGEDGVSAMGNCVQLARSSARLIGWMKVSSVIRYTSFKHFRQDEARHLVQPTSGYAWKEDITGCIYGWVIDAHELCDDTSEYFSATRRKRSLFELQPLEYDP